MAYIVYGKLLYFGHHTVMKTLEHDRSHLNSSDDRRTRAIVCAQAAIDMMKEKGISALIIGSLAKGNFGPDSDIDFLITCCPRKYKYAIEAKVEDILGDLPFDLVYLEEIPADRVEQFTTGAVDAGTLR
jgi:predicted nucleotidyltransferase